MALAFTAWAGGGAFLLTGLIALHALQFLASATGRLRARRAFTSEALSRAEGDLRVGITTSIHQTMNVQPDEPTRKARMPALFP
jgi:hypothetical protein